MKARRKAPRSTASAREIERLKKANKRLRRLLKEERARWDEKWPKGHLCRHDLCTVECYIVVLDPIDTPFLRMLPKTTSDGLMHEWTTDKLTPYDQGEIDLTEKQTGWWIRIPYGWWLKLKGWFRGKA